MPASVQVTPLSQVAAHELGLDPAAISIRYGDTSVTPFGFGDIDVGARWFFWQSENWTDLSRQGLGVTGGSTIAPVSDSFVFVGQGYLPRLVGDTVAVVLFALLALLTVRQRRNRQRYQLPVVPVWQGGNIFIRDYRKPETLATLQTIKRPTKVNPDISNDC